jgi:hypothetical protein
MTKLLLEAWRRFESEGGNCSDFTVLRLCDKIFPSTNRRAPLSPDTFFTNRWHLNVHSQSAPVFQGFLGKGDFKRYQRFHVANLLWILSRMDYIGCTEFP